MEPDRLFAGAESEEPLVDLEGLQFESAAEGALQNPLLSTCCGHCQINLASCTVNVLAKWGMGQLFSTAAVVTP